MRTFKVAMEALIFLTYPIFIWLAGRFGKTSLGLSTVVSLSLLSMFGGLLLVAFMPSGHPSSLADLLAGVSVFTLGSWIGALVHPITRGNVALATRVAGWSAIWGLCFLNYTQFLGLSF